MRAAVIGAGLAGSEAAWQLAKRGIDVTLYEMKPCRMSPAHKSPLFAELVCSNSLRSDRLQNAVGLLKEEMRLLDSLVMRSADKARVPAGGALAVDRESFSGFITDTLRGNPHVTVVEEEITEIPEGSVIIATGPLTSDALAEKIAALPGMSTLHFFDAAAPIVMADSLDTNQVFRASRYGRGDDYLNCPMDREQYDAFVEALLSAETAPVHGFEENMVFEGCMPVESMARRGHMVLAFGPMKPVGLPDPRTGREAYAVVQLRQDDAAGSMYNLVGFQTRLKFGEQKRVFGMIPGLENAEFARYGVMHRNTFLHSPGLLDATYQMIDRPGTYFAGQMTGVEGYVESAASGLLAGLALAARLNGRDPIDFGTSTAIGALAHYISTPNSDFQPMNITFGLIDPLDKRVRNKAQRYELISQRAISVVRDLSAKLDN
ncbi:MAG: methylenetetrahydrofolate--tRNA-(uracil(54)-C(5))-methyltransferase (FADH(2)-oxidizing) TrmFO [Clostridia bacterium]|nr:methylenetetrahydrofolate--tRNA-(uracil(54)-C(5))-methyltransferase (FADH(2)-oxidizing) TrmFO [Clostridia bacterium]